MTTPKEEPAPADAEKPTEEPAPAGAEKPTEEPAPAEDTAQLAAADESEEESDVVYEYLYESDKNDALASDEEVVYDEIDGDEQTNDAWVVITPKGKGPGDRYNLWLDDEEVSCCKLV